MQKKITFNILVLVFETIVCFVIWFQNESFSVKEKLWEVSYSQSDNFHRMQASSQSF